MFQSLDFSVHYIVVVKLIISCVCFFFQAEDGIRDLVRSRGLGDVYKRQAQHVAGLQAGAGAGRTGRHRDALHAHDQRFALDLSLIHI